LTSSELDVAGEGLGTNKDSDKRLEQRLGAGDLGTIYTQKIYTREIYTRGFDQNPAFSGTHKTGNG
jgi:hypothetical protein